MSIGISKVCWMSICRLEVKPHVRMTILLQGIFVCLYHTDQLQETHATGVHTAVDSTLREMTLAVFLA